MNELDDLTDASEAAAARTAEVFEDAGARIAAALEGAARSGELSFDRLAESILQDLARTAISDLLVAPLSGAIASIGSSGKGGGATSQAPAAPLNLTLNLSGVSDPKGFARSSQQVAAAVSRATSRGGRYG